MKWLLNFLGIILYFLGRYKNRTNKDDKFSAVFWLNDNWIETVGTLVVNVIILILFHYGGVTIDLNKWMPWLPDGIAFAGDLAIYTAIGWVISHTVYEIVLNRKKA